MQCKTGNHFVHNRISFEAIRSIFPKDGFDGSIEGTAESILKLEAKTV